MINNYEDAFRWYQENDHRIDRFEFVEDDGSRRPLTNTEMYWLTQIRQAEDDGVDVPTDPQAQLEQALLRICELTRKSGELEADNARLRDSLKVERDAVKRLNVKVAEASTLTSRLTAAEARYETLAKSMSCYRCADMRERLAAAEAVVGQIAEAKAELVGSIPCYEAWMEHSSQRQWELYRWRVEELERTNERLAAAEAEIRRLKYIQCQWCRGGFDAGD